MPPSLSTRELSREEHPRWVEFVHRHAGGSPYALPEYLEALSQATGAGFAILVCERDGEILGGIPLFERASWAGRWVGPRLLLYYNGPVLADPSTRYPSQHSSLELRVLDGLCEAIDRRGYASVRLHPRETVRDIRVFLARGWKARPSYSYLLRLDDMEAAWKRVEGNFRRLVRRCDEDGIRLARDEEFGDLFTLHEEIHLRKGAPLYLPRSDFEPFYRRLSEAGLARLYHARDREGRALASQLVLAGEHPVTHTICAGSATDSLGSGASVFLRWKAAEALAEEGYLANDLTDAELNPVTRFKSQLGAELVDSHFLESPASRAWRVRAALDTAVAFPRRAARAAARRLSTGASRDA